MKTPRELWNEAVTNAGLTIRRMSSDGWIYSARRADGLYIWRLSEPGTLQTAFVNEKGLMSDHRMYQAQDVVDALSLAIERERADE